MTSRVSDHGVKAMHLDSKIDLVRMSFVFSVAVLGVQANVLLVRVRNNRNSEEE